jgi:hypothetical protein
MRRFFLALGVGVEHVTRPLPDIPQVVQLAADGRLGQALRAPALQVLAQQRDGPRDRLVAEVLRPPLEAGDESRLEFLGPQAGVIAPALVDQGGRVAGLSEARDPGVNADAAGAEEAGDLGDGAAASGFQDCQSAAVEASIRSIVQLLFQSASLGGGQLQAAHGQPRFLERTATS